MRALGGDFISLIAWYKLNGDLLDSSGNGNHLSVKGSVPFVPGGITVPSAVSFSDNPANVLYRTHFTEILQTFTLSCWVKPAASDSNIRFIVSQGRDVGSGGISLVQWENNQFCAIVGSTQYLYLGTGSVKPNEWTHLSITSDCCKFKAYLNGILVASELINPAFSSISLNETSGVFAIGKMSYNYASDTVHFPFNGLVQDVRIYDHCLSDKEIYELAKAKILHYTFDDVEEPTINLFPVNASLMSIRDGTDSSWELYKDSYDNIIYKFNRVNQVLYEYNGFDTSVIVGDKYTLSLDVYVSTDYDRTSGILVRVEKAISSNFELDNSKKGMWQKAIITGVCSTTILRTLLYPSPETTSGTKGYILYRNPQLEKKDHATPFVNGTRDQIIVRDKSDYGNDSLPLTVATTPAFVEDCKIGKQGVAHNRLSYIATNKDNLKPRESITLSAFVKLRDYVAGHQTILTLDSSYYLSIDSGKLETYAYGRTTAYKTSTSTLNLNQWYHVAAIITRTHTYLYIDGTLDSSFANDATADISYPTMTYQVSSGLCYPTMTYQANILMDDLRIYATALTAEDIKEIYQSRANLDDKGNLSVVSLNQQGVSSISLTEKGVYNTVEISEVGVTEGLIAWYPLNGDAKDYSGNGNDGVVSGATVAAGQGQKCYSFDGSTSKIILPRTFLRLPTFSCSLWFDWKNRDSVSRTLFSMTENGGWRIGLSEGGSPNNLSFQIYDTPTYRWVPIPNSSIPTGWNNVSVSYDNISKLAILYINAVEVARTTLTNGLTYGTEVNPLIGCEASVENANSNMFNGSIQDVRIYNRALTPEEVLINYNLTKADKTAMIQAKNGTTYVNKIKEV